MATTPPDQDRSQVQNHIGGGSEALQWTLQRFWRSIDRLSRHQIGHPFFRPLIFDWGCYCWARVEHGSHWEHEKKGRWEEGGVHEIGQGVNLCPDLAQAGDLAQAVNTLQNWGPLVSRFWRVKGWTQRRSHSGQRSSDAFWATCRGSIPGKGWAECIRSFTKWSWVSEYARQWWSWKSSAQVVTFK